MDENKKTIIHDSSFVLPNILNVYFPGQKAEDLLIKLDMMGIAVSSGAACLARHAKQSHVLKALGYKKARINESIRFSFGRFTTESDIRETIKRIKSIFM